MLIVTNVLCSLRSAWKALCRSARGLRREYIIEQYLRAGARFGDALGRLEMGECVPLDSMIKHFAKLERRYASLGYRTIPLQEFVEYGAYGRAIHNLLRVQRELGEAAIYHADRLQEEYRTNGLAPMTEFGKNNNWLHCGLDKTKTPGCDGRDDCRHNGEDTDDV